MKFLLICVFFSVVLVAAKNSLQAPDSQSAQSGKTLYVTPPVLIDSAKERLIQKKDQNRTGHGSAK